MKIGNNESFMAGTNLAAGSARSGETCGALTGLLMVLGIVSGRRKIDDVDAYQASMKLAIEARELFREAVGNTICAEIQKSLLGRSYRMYDDEDRERFHNDGGHTREMCPGVCGKAAGIAAEIILDRGLKP